MLRRLARSLVDLCTRLAAEADQAFPSGEAPFSKLRRTGSALLVAGGAGLIAVTLASNDGSATLEGAPPPPAAGVIRLGDELASQSAAPIRPAVEAPSTQSLANPTGASLVVSVARSYPFIWPAEGPLTSEMGPWHPIGIDVGLDYDVDSPIWASARGTVTFAGGEEWETYGHHVIIDHGGGMETLYAHLYEVFVREGQMVEQGELLGYGGDTGVAEGKHLHFEVHHGKSQIDPQHVLPPYGEGRPAPLAADCGEEAIVVDSGAPLLLDFSAALGSGASLEDVTIEKMAVSPKALPAVASVKDGTSVLFDTTPTVAGTGDDDEYRLIASAGTLSGLTELSCTVFVRTRTVAPSFYVRPTSTPTPIPTPDATYTPSPTPTPTDTPTPTPTPTKTPFPSPKKKS